MAGPRLQMSPTMERGPQERTGSAECQGQDQGAETLCYRGREGPESPSAMGTGPGVWCRRNNTLWKEHGRNPSVESSSDRVETPIMTMMRKI